MSIILSVRKHKKGTKALLLRINSIGEKIMDLRKHNED